MHIYICMCIYIYIYIYIYAHTPGGLVRTKFLYYTGIKLALI